MTDMDELTVTILRENRAPEGLAPGHGLAMLAEVGDAAFLLDTGDSPQTWDNADALGVDLERVQCLVLSHGHYDHTGGIEELLRRVGRLRIVAHPAVFEPRWADDGGSGLHHIGQPRSREEFEAMGASFELDAAPVQVVPGAMTTGWVPRDEWPMPEQSHLLVERDGRVQPDDFVDDLSVVVSLGEAAVLLTGCAHAGLLNIAAQAERVAGRPVRAIIGGTHLMHTPEDEVARIAAALHHRGVTHIAPMHCTGESGRRALSRHFEGELLGAQTGDRIIASGDGITIAAPAGQYRT
ncbi:MAG: MBL fold metallo-hydrolase [Armatimonadetes bacterium]|nr:MBL fold metallo-hydrolase [Armatimonadota bacterium]